MGLLQRKRDTVDVAGGGDGGGFFFLVVCGGGWMWLVEAAVSYCWLWHGWLVCGGCGMGGGLRKRER